MCLTKSEKLMGETGKNYLNQFLASYLLKGEKKETDE